MPAADEIKAEYRVAEIVDMAVRALVANLGISTSEASHYLFIAAGKTMTPTAMTDAINRLHRSTKGMPCIG